MTPDEPGPDGAASASTLTRRNFLKVAGAAGLTYAALASGPGILTSRARAATTPTPGMNILFVMVDQMRTPWVYMPPALQRATVPTISALARKGVAFSHYYTSSNDCTPSRTTQATGLYTHQTGIFATTPPTNLNPGFPTFGTMLRQQGYETYWFGKWHMSGDNVTGACEPNPYEAYGFTANWPGSGTCPSPNGGPGVGQAMDPVIRQQFVDWIGGRAAGGTPWLSVVSFVNPHDIAWYPRSTRQIEGESKAPRIYTALPDNYETRTERAERHKPLMQTRSMQIENEAFGVLPRGRTPTEPWTKMLDTYLVMQRQVDIQIAMVLKALSASPFADNTIVVFASDHGEYAGAHGMRGKGMAFYDEGIRVPLIVHDPTGGWTKATGSPRQHLVESVDLAAMFMTFATGGNDWRGNSTYAQIAGRADIAGICQRPSTPGRPYIAHATDEPGTSTLIPTAQQIAPAPNHILGVRTRQGKIAQYAYWKDGTLTVDASRPIQREAYDYSTKAGRLEVDNICRPKGTSRADRAFVKRMQVLLEKAIENEIQAPLPAALQPVQDQAFAAWFAQPTGGWTRATVN